MRCRSILCCLFMVALLNHSICKKQAIVITCECKNDCLCIDTDVFILLFVSSISPDILKVRPYWSRSTPRSSCRYLQFSSYLRKIYVLHITPHSTARYLVLNGHMIMWFLSFYYCVCDSKVTVTVTAAVIQDSKIESILCMKYRQEGVRYTVIRIFLQACKNSVDEPYSVEYLILAICYLSLFYIYLREITTT